jgi:hypothetical protein
MHTHTHVPYSKDGITLEVNFVEVLGEGGKVGLDADEEGVRHDVPAVEHLKIPEQVRRTVLCVYGGGEREERRKGIAVLKEGRRRGGQAKTKASSHAQPHF